MPEFAKIERFISAKYNLSVIRSLLKAPQGTNFNFLLKELRPITPRVLSGRLKELEKIGLVQKNLVLGQKPKIEYRTTSKSEGLKKALAELEKWGKKEIE